MEATRAKYGYSKYEHRRQMPKAEESEPMFAVNRKHLQALLRGIRFLAKTTDELTEIGLEKLASAPEWLPMGYSELHGILVFSLDYAENKARRLVDRRSNGLGRG